MIKKGHRMTRWGERMPRRAGGLAGLYSMASRDRPIALRF